MQEDQRIKNKMEERAMYCYKVKNRDMLTSESTLFKIRFTTLNNVLQNLG